MCANLTVYSLILHSRFAPQFIKQGRQDEGFHPRLPGQIDTGSCELVQRRESPEDKFALVLATINVYFDFVFDFFYWLCWEPSTSVPIFSLGVATTTQHREQNV